MDSAHRRNRKKKTPPPIGLGTKFSRTAAAADRLMMHIIAKRFLQPQVRDSTRLTELARAPYDIAEMRVVEDISLSAAIVFQSGEKLLRAANTKPIDMERTRVRRLPFVSDTILF
ncbi:unnamed protein product [Leptidea sinapis]|uniref:Uncharacterized protein n=1 Tax=Leptidea sinapis TaxID=189913 RepID=A0A5E4QU19_9NEOP|nr:unnamed protein product [Leptidea sinapis]